ncbi:MAG: hypothetical protein H7641_13610 [Candidatus Heimdallarchaeota archaeon]|nr:hypothetical protein [Candidatus Heimdallarchaeota archaeon]MCK4878598.1 hypothetical protein [Candidatus Heimdallarchaeota archaeon]
MKTQDVMDPNFKQKPVLLIKEEEKLLIMSNPNYYPILMSLREGCKTVKEIEEDFTKYILKDLKKQGITDEKKIKEIVDKKKRSDKSLYRYIQHLIDADFVALVGKRVAMEKSMTEKLFARTARFFFVDSYYEKMICADSHCIDSIAQLLEVIYEVPQPSKKNIEQFINLMNESSKKITSLLFNEKSEEFVEMVDSLSLAEVTAVLQTISLIDLVVNSKKTTKLLENIEKK